MSNFCAIKETWDMSAMQQFSLSHKITGLSGYVSCSITTSSLMRYLVFSAIMYMSVTSTILALYQKYLEMSNK